ncbi:hypothetical protein [Prochlorococcus marinus]|uniref:Uncharacterized protein n=1 Tax=Prochlorococcus marinus str. SB TaxID=59926 RepID=A0A0A2B260_PROMR|nr:hypothetical protein EV02_0821 [Prochlorococcus marinus str. SB]
MKNQRWFKTPEAKVILGCSDQYLKKNRDTHGGFLEEEVHYRFGGSVNSPIYWNVEEIMKVFHDRGKTIRLGREMVKQVLQGEE